VLAWEFGMVELLNSFAGSADDPSALSAKREYWSSPKRFESLRRCADETSALPALDHVLAYAS